MPRPIASSTRTPILFVLAALLTPGLASAQVTEIIDSTGDGAGNALLGPRGLGVDEAGNVYVTGQPSNNVFKITDPCGAAAISEIIDASGDGAGNPLDGPIGLAVDGSGNVYVAGFTSANAFKITPGGVITEIIDAAGDGDNVLLGSFAIAVDDAGNVYVSGQNTANVFQITPGGRITEIIDATGDGAGNPFGVPRGLAVDGLGNVYASGSGSHNVFKIADPGGANTITEIIDSSGDGAGNILAGAYGLAVDAAGTLYVAGRDTSNAFKIEDPGGANAITEIIDATGDGLGNALNRAIGIALDEFSNVYLTGFTSDNAFKITPGGAISELIDATGDGAGNTLVGSAEGIGVDSSGNLYVAAFKSSNAFKILVPECFLVLGDGPGDASYVGAGHLFETQLNQVDGSYPVLMNAIAEIEVPVIAGSSLGGHVFSTSGSSTGIGWTHRANWVLSAQILMWNPQVFPGQPEQYTSGMMISVSPSGTLRTRTFGNELGGLEMAPELRTGAEGELVLAFPFTIEGF